ncbi:hypothetical protein GKO28_12545 [Deefgea sp. CFH1-16]|nr:hypothetical protein [Deefgea sp. CFH1-16]
MTGWLLFSVAAAAAKASSISIASVGSCAALGVALVSTWLLGSLSVCNAGSSLMLPLRARTSNWSKSISWAMSSGILLSPLLIKGSAAIPC